MSYRLRTIYIGHCKELKATGAGLDTADGAGDQTEAEMFENKQGTVHLPTSCSITTDHDPY